MALRMAARQSFGGPRVPRQIEPSAWGWLKARADAASRLGVYLSAAFLVAAGIYGAALGGHLTAWRATALERFETALIAGGFGINDVIITGRDHISPAQVDAALDTTRARTIFGFDTRAAKARLERIGWVEKARVMRLWPSTLVVELSEREPFAQWDIRGHRMLIDKTGELLGPATPAFEDLPRVAGEGADIAASALFDTLAQHEPLAQRVVLAQRIEKRRWDLVARGGLRVQLPAHGVANRLPKAERLIAGKLPDGVGIIDMRVEGRIALRRGRREHSTPGPTARMIEQPGRARAQPL